MVPQVVEAQRFVLIEQEAEQALADGRVADPPRGLLVHSGVQEGREPAVVAADPSAP